MIARLIGFLEHGIDTRPLDHPGVMNTPLGLTGEILPDFRIEEFCPAVCL